ncbi:MAG: HAD family hydrolase [Halobacteriales archaeon]|nr:HAD family hydrolase [Halobacteriales archaeon]
MSRTGPLDVEAVLWDIGGVLLDLESVRAGHEAFLAWLVDTHDLGSVEEAVESWRATVGEHFRSRDGTSFRPAREGYHRAVETLLGRSVDRQAWQPRFRRVLRDHLRPNAGAVETVERLAATDRHQGVLSDVDADEGRFILDHLGVLDRLDAVTTSEAVGWTKPNPAMFEAALDRAGVPPDRAAMIGDRYRHDMAGANALGIRTVAYGAADGPAVDHRVDDLRELLVLLGVE